MQHNAQTGMQARCGISSAAGRSDPRAPAWKVHPAFVDTDYLNKLSAAAMKKLYPDGLGPDGLFHLQNNVFQEPFVRDPVTVQEVVVQSGWFPNRIKWQFFWSGRDRQGGQAGEGGRELSSACKQGGPRI